MEQRRYGGEIMSSFLKFLTSPDPGDHACAVCGRNRYFCDCDETAAVDAPEIITMYHAMSHKKMTVERYSDKYFVMRSQNWIELSS
jgi:hypothetical protein